MKSCATIVKGRRRGGHLRGSNWKFVFYSVRVSVFILFSFLKRDAEGHGTAQVQSFATRTQALRAPLPGTATVLPTFREPTPPHRRSLLAACIGRRDSLIGSYTVALIITPGGSRNTNSIEVRTHRLSMFAGRGRNLPVSGIPYANPTPFQTNQCESSGVKCSSLP